MNEPELVVTREEILRGWKDVKVKLRDGSTRTVMVKAMSWRTALITSAMFAKGEMAEGVLKVLEQSLPVDVLSDNSMNQFVPAELNHLALVAQVLTNGVPEAKNEQAGTQEASPAEVRQDLPITGKSNVSYEPAVSEMRPG